MTTISIVQDYIPEFRVPFFRELERLGLADSVHYVVFASEVRKVNTSIDFQPVQLRTMKLYFIRQFYLHVDLSPIENSDVIIVEQALHNPKLLRALTNGRLSQSKFIFWGHGGYWVRKVSRLQKALLQNFINKADHYLVYTEEGAIRLIEYGLPLEKISILRNSIDTSKILANILRISTEEQSAWMNLHDLKSPHLGCFIGVFKVEKNLDFLIESLVQIRQFVPDFEFIFFGSGPGIKYVKDACENYSWIKFGGVAAEQEKAHLAIAKSIILNPGRVGLLAVDSIAMAVPLVTRDLEYTHAPEIDYLKDQESMVMTGTSLDEYVQGVVKLFQNPGKRAELSQALAALQPRYSIEKMAANFHAGVMKVL